jgi:O-antigen ligase
MLLFAGAAYALWIDAGLEQIALWMALGVVLACAFRFSNADTREVEALAQAWLLAGLLSALMGVLQFGGLAAKLAPWISYTEGEAFGNLRQRNLYASLTSISLCALLWLTGSHHPRFSRPAWAAGLAAALATGNALSHSRTGFCELVLIVLLAAYWRLHKVPATRWAMAATIPTYVLAAVCMPWLLHAAADQNMISRFTDGAPTCMSRLSLWANVLELIQHHPWVGWGWGELDYAHFITPYRSTRFCAILDNAHNLPLHLAVELGLPCALLACGALAWSTWRARPWAENQPHRQLAWGVLLILSLHSLLEYPLWYGPFQLALGMCIGLLWRRPPLYPTPPMPATWPAHPFIGRHGLLRISLAGALATGIVLAAQDYDRVSQIYLAPEDRAPAYQQDTLAQMRHVILFKDQARFAELTLQPLTVENAQWTYDTASFLLHFSPERRVIEKAIESAEMLGYTTQARLYESRYAAAFPEEYAQWHPTRRQPQPASTAAK